MYFLLLILIYIAFISLGLPDSVLGAAWPSMYRSFGVPEGSAGNFTMLCLMALPYGLGGGCVDASLNNYVATHYKARHMSFLHCFWGIGTIISPLIMGTFIENGGMWTQGYRAIAVFQFILVAVLMLSIPLWKKDSYEHSAESNRLSARNLMKIRGVKASLIAFFSYCALETTMGLWTSTYLSEVKGVDIILATKCGMLFYIGIASGRFNNNSSPVWYHCQPYIDCPHAWLLSDLCLDIADYVPLFPQETSI